MKVRARKRGRPSSDPGEISKDSISGKKNTNGSCRIRKTRNEVASRSRRNRRPHVKDLAVSLGLEKPPDRLTKVQKNQCNDDELQELRFKEEIHKLSNLEEVLRLSKAHDLASDDDSVNGDGAICMELSDEEDNDMCKKGEVQCPKPLPRRDRGGNNSLRRNSRNVEVSKDEVKQMCLIIRSSMRRSLTSTSNNVSLKPEDYDFFESDAEERESKIVVSSASVPEPGENDSNSNFIMFRTLRQVVDLQDRWLNEKKTAYSTSPSDRYAVQQQVNYRAGSNGFGKQIYIEHLSWITTDVSSDGKIRIANNDVLAWLPSFRKKFVQRYPQLLQNATPLSGTDLDILLQIATVKVYNKMEGILNALLTTRLALVELIEHVSEVYYEKRAICTEFELIHENVNMRSARYDESSAWGLKPIRLALEPPYIKTEDGLMAYPMTPDAISRVTNFSCCFFKRDKQKWTTKDLQQLKLCIKESLHSKQLTALNDRYEILLSDCLLKYNEDMEKEGRLDNPPTDAFKKRRGRPKRSELEYSSKYGIIYPAIDVLKCGITLRTEVSPRILAERRAIEEKRVKCKTYEELVFMENEKIDWDTVANKMVVKSRKHRTAEDCELAWKHEVHPKVNDKRWGVEESKRLKEIYLRLRNDWFAVAQELNIPTELAGKPGRTPYQCYFRVRNRLDPPKKLAWPKELDDHVVRKLKEHPGNWRLVAASINDPAATKRQVIERYKKTINPVLRNGAFTRVEDCLLILTIEKLKPFLAREGHFGCLLAYLPWRCETTWRDRANNLFSDWIVPWTLEEDKMLLKLAKTMNRNWQKISEEFTSFKNRKGCLTRYKILMRRLKDERFNNSLEAYHEAYAMTRYNVFQYKHLKEMLELLIKVQGTVLPPKHRHFGGLLRDEEPSEVRLQHMLLTFDKDILDSTIRSLTRYVQTRDDYWRNWISQHGKRKRTFDRRTFHPDNPQSVASALHIRGLELKPKEDIPNLSDFEDEIFKFYARFRRTKALKPDADRPYIPDAKTLAQWSVVSRLVETSVDQLEDVPLKRKWKALKTNDAQVPRFTVKRKKQESPIIKCEPLRKKIRKPKKEKLKKVPKGVKPVKRGRPNKVHAKNGKRGKVTAVTNEEGYILIPPEPDMKKSLKRRSKRKTADDCDPEFVVGPVNRDKYLKLEGMPLESSASHCRRSSRMSKKRFEVNDERDEL